MDKINQMYAILLNQELNDEEKILALEDLGYEISRAKQMIDSWNITADWAEKMFGQGVTISGISLKQGIEDAVNKEWNDRQEEVDMKDLAEVPDDFQKYADNVIKSLT